MNKICTLECCAFMEKSLTFLSKLLILESLVSTKGGGNAEGPEHLKNEGFAGKSS